MKVTREDILRHTAKGGNMPPIIYTYIALLADSREIMFDAPYIEKARQIAEAEAKERQTKVIKVRRW